MTLTPAFLDELRARTLLSALVGKTVKLTKAGREFKGCCPFHNEKTPSFYVNDDKGFYHCFGCSAHGDAIRWMTEQRGLPFIDAVKELAQAAGMEMPAQDRQSVERAERAKGLHEAMADAAAWFTEQLNGIAGAEARAVLEQRGIDRQDRAARSASAIRPDTRGRLREALKTYGDPLLIESGMLIKVDDKEPYDRFRGRLMIPIRDPRGRVDRVRRARHRRRRAQISQLPRHPALRQGAHALQSRQAPRPPARKSGRVIVVEGYMDVIALAQAGFGEAVAPLGTALTEAQLERLWRIADVPILCFDGDAAGQKAAIRAALARAARARAGPQPVVRDAARGSGPRRPGPRARAGGVRGAARQARTAGRSALGARICRRTARHARTARGPQAPPRRSRRDDRRWQRPPRISRRIPPPRRRPVRARRRATSRRAPSQPRRPGVKWTPPLPPVDAAGQGGARRRASTACWPRRCWPG